MSDDESIFHRGNGNEPARASTRTKKKSSASPAKASKQELATSEQEDRIPRNATIIVGPSRCGKTVWLSIAPSFANKANVARVLLPAGIFECNFFPRNDNMKLLAGLGRQLVKDGRTEKIAGSKQTTIYNFELRVECEPTKKSKLLSMFSARQQSHRSTFSAVDGPGGSVFGSLDAQKQKDNAISQTDLNKYRSNLVEAAKTAKGLIICVDASDPVRASSVLMDLPDFLYDIGDPLPMSKICIMLNKAEKVVEHKYGAAGELSRMCPVQKVKELLGASLGALMMYAQNTPINVGWTSSFGFVPSSGAPNFRAFSDDDDMLNVHSDDPEMMQKIAEIWTPYRVLDPLIYMTSGHPCDLRLLG